MKQIKIVTSASYLPKRKIVNEEIEQELNLEKGYIYKRTGIQERFYVEDETIEEMAIEAVKKIKNKQNLEELGLIIVATTSSGKIMPGIANEVQKQLQLPPCICLDILAGCSGFINAVDIAKMYIQTERVKKALVIGVDLLSKTIAKEDIATLAVLSDGAGAILLEATDEEKQYVANIQAEPDQKNILNYQANQTIQMNGKEVYRYAVTKTVENIETLLTISGEKIESVKYIIPHQSNIKILNAIENRLKITKGKLYKNIEHKGNTFCASIPIALEELQEKRQLQSGDKIILLGYGGGLNTGSIFMSY